MTDPNPPKKSARKKSARKPSGPRSQGGKPRGVAPTSAKVPANNSVMESPPESTPAPLSLPPLQPGSSLTIPESAAGQTVLAVLRAVRPGESWSKLRSLMHKAYVSLNSTVCVDEARRVVTGDVLELGEQPNRLPPKSSDVHIVYVDAHVVVVEKPTGMMTHRRPEERNWSDERKARQPALDESLNDLLQRRAVGSGRNRPRQSQVRCVHRLDRDTSGILVFARNEAAEESLVSQFRRHSVVRAYWAIVHGRPQDGTIVSNLVRDRGDGRRGSVQNPKVGQRAVTHVRWLEQLGDYSLVECRLETGRTNQIRIHMAEAGHMVCGDPKYNQPYGTEAQRDTSQAPRLALHAAELGFLHPVSGEELFFQMPFPADLEDFATKLRKTSRRIRN
jgi:23S rRNA pseudouridine1911/1915/1917 synthase